MYTQTYTHTQVVTVNYPNNKRYISSRSVFYRSPGRSTEVCSRLISTVERSKTRHTGDGSKWCVIACSILPPLLRNVSQEFTAPCGDAAASMCFLAFSRPLRLHLPSRLNDEGRGRRLWTPPISLTKLNKCSSDLSHDLQGFSSARRNEKEKPNSHNNADMFARSRLLTWERAWQSHYCWSKQPYVRDVWRNNTCGCQLKLSGRLFESSARFLHVKLVPQLAPVFINPHSPSCSAWN